MPAQKREENKMKFLRSLVAVEDINLSRIFYEKLMQQKVKYDFGVNVTFEGGFAILLKSHFSKLIDDKTITKASNSFELYFEYDNIDLFVKKLKNNKVEFIHETREQPWRQKVVRFYDPDKNIIEVGESREFLFFRLSKEGKNIEEISKITKMPIELVSESMREMNSAGHST
jgi:catechol 2,3-dioxygenase-like lactoylglutathione lyase family enzyme